MKYLQSNQVKLGQTVYITYQVSQQVLDMNLAKKIAKCYEK